MKLKEIASILDGEILGDESIEIKGVSGFNDVKEGEITFIASNKLIKKLSECKASSIIVKEFINGITIPQIKVSNPYIAFIKLLNHFYVKPHKSIGISNKAFISEIAKIGKNVSIYPYVFISDNVSIEEDSIIYPFTFIGENASIGKNCTIYPNVVIRENIKIGNNVIIHSGTVIGSDGFGYVFDGSKHQKIPQVGGIIIEDDVEIGANVTIDRATTGNTIIGSGTKIDNLVQIAHNVKIGKNSIIVAQVGIAGSSEIGDHVTLAGQVGISDHSIIESETIIGAQSGVMGSVKKGVYSGTPAIEHRDWLKAQAVFIKLPELYKKIKELENKLNELERRISK